MSLLDSLAAWLRSKDMNERAITPAQIFNTGLDEYYETQTATGINITAEAAMQSAVGACVRLLADDISALPLDVFRKVDGDSVETETPPWLDSPSGRRWDTSATFISDTVVSLGTDGGFFWLGTPNLLAIERLEVVDPSIVTIRERDGAVIYDVNGREYGDDRLLYQPWIRLPGQLRGINIVKSSKDSSGLELAAREWAGSLFGHGATLGGLIEVPGTMSDEEKKKLRKDFAIRHQGRRKSHALGILTGGAKYRPDVSLKPQEAELKPLWAHVLEEAARLFHIPPHLLASQDPGGSSYSSVEQRSIEYVQHGIVPFTTRIERPLTRLLQWNEAPNAFAKLNVNGLLRGDFQTRAQGYRALLESRVINKETVRALEDLPKDDTEVGYLATPNNQTRNFRTEDARALVQAGYDPADVLSVVGLPPMEHVGLTPTTLYEDTAAPADAGRLSGVTVEGRMTDEAVASIRDALSSEVVAHLAASDMRMDRLEETIRADITKATAPPPAEPPKQTSVIRDDFGRIVSVVERQGDRTVRRVIERDEHGSFITMREVAA